MSCVIERQGDIGVYVLCYRQDRETLESMSCVIERQDRETLESMSCVIDRTGRHWSLCPVL